MNRLVGRHGASRATSAAVKCGVKFCLAAVGRVVIAVRKARGAVDFALTRHAGRGAVGPARADVAASAASARRGVGVDFAAVGRVVIAVFKTRRAA